MEQESRAADLLAASVLVGLAALTIWESTRWPETAGFAGNPTLVPRMLAALMLATALGLAIPALRRQGSTGDPAWTGGALLAAGATLVLAIALPFLGVLGAGIPYLLALQRIGRTPWRLALPVAIVAPLAVWLAFARGLNVPLPSGTLWSALGI